MMDKQEAIQFILHELELNRPQDEIASSLNQQLNAPPSLLSKFVVQVVAENQPSPTPSPPAASPLPIHSDIPQPEPIIPSNYPDIETASDELASVSANDIEVSPSPPSDYAFQIDKQPDYDPEELEMMILKALRKDRRHSDIVMDVCENTGMSWDQAQRLVARVATDKRNHLVSRQNMVIIPLAALAVLAGLALFGASPSEGLKLARLLAEAPSEFPAEASAIEFFIREGLWGLVIGMSLILGGIYGMIRALQSQFD